VSKYLQIYLQDHYAGAMAGVELSRRIAGTGPELRAVADEIAADREALRDVMERFGVHGDRLKSAGAWAGEKLGRLKLNGELLRASPLSRVVELEGLTLGVTGKLSMWRALRHVHGGDARLGGVDLDALIARAESQLARLEPLRLDAAQRALDSG
jgi:hypothetical protein